MLVTIIANSGSTLEGAGSRMPVKRDSTIKGIVGSDTVGYQATLTAVEAIKHKSSHTKGFTLTRDQAVDIGMVYGGNVVAYSQYISPDSKELTGFCTDIQTALSRDEDSWLLLDITNETCWQMGLYSEGTGFLDISMPEHLMDSDLFGCSTLQKEAEGRRYYMEPLIQAGTVCVFSGGHMVQELIPMLIHMRFRCAITDDREEFVNPRVFPTATDTIMGGLERIGNYIKIRPYSYICVITKGHRLGYYAQKQTATSKPRYIGVMGSRNKMRVVTDKLPRDGSPREETEGCHIPIRTGVHAETPVEIAIGIAREPISVRAAGMGLESKVNDQKWRKSRTGNLTVR